jgi:hypothetical protein
MDWCRFLPAAASANTLNHFGNEKEQNVGHCSRDQMKNLPVEISEGNALVLLDRHFRFLGIAFCADRRRLVAFFEGTHGVLQNLLRPLRVTPGKYVMQGAESEICQ